MASSLYEKGYYEPFGLYVDPDSLDATKANLTDGRGHYIKSLDAIVQGAMIHSLNLVLSYNPFADGESFRSALLPGKMEEFFMKIGVKEIILQQNPSLMDIKKYLEKGYFIVALGKFNLLENNKYETTWGIPDHYVQVTGTSSNGINFWPWGNNELFTTNCHLHGIFTIKPHSKFTKYDYR